MSSEPPLLSPTTDKRIEQCNPHASTPATAALENPLAVFAAGLGST